MLKLSGKVAIVTGASSGVGAGVAKVLALSLIHIFSAFILMVSRDNYNSRAVEVDGLLYNETKSKKTGKTG